MGMTLGLPEEQLNNGTIGITHPENEVIKGISEWATRMSWQIAYIDVIGPKLGSHILGH